jgi:hypothetical protein
MTNLNEHFLTKLMASNKGIHISAYIENMGVLKDVKLQLREAVDTATEILEPAINEIEIKRLVAPIERLITDERALKNLTSNFAVFRTVDTFRIIPIPTEIEQICVVASSFHVKPLISWVQADPEFLVFTLDKQNVSIFAGSGKNVDFMDQYRHKDFKDCFEWLNDWLQHNNVAQSKKIFIATQEKFGPKQLSYIDRPNVHFLNRNIGSHIKNIAEAAQKKMKELNDRELERNLIDFNFALVMELTQNNIADIAKSAVKGEITKLLIAKDVNVFGTVNRATGKLAINPFQLDHEDDDILDDLAQIVVLNGGKVIAIDKDKIPGKRVAIAIRNQDRKYG